MMTDREKLVELLETAESAVYWNSSEKSFVEKIADHLIANGLEKVVYCGECINHGHCIPEDTFNLVGMKKPFCAAGKAKEVQKNV